MSSFLCSLQDLGQGSQNLFSAAIRIRPKFRVSLHGMNNVVTPVLKYPVVHTLTCVWLHFSPPTLVGSYHQFLPHAISCSCPLTVFLYRNPLKFPEPPLGFCDKPKLLIHKSFNRLQSFSAPLSVSDPAVYMSNLPGYLLQITGLGLC